MIETLHNIPENVAGFRATGKVTKEDYKTIIEPKVKELAENAPGINFLFLLDTDVSNFSAGALMEDALMGLKEFTHWHRVAVVSDSSFIKNGTDIFGFIAPGEYKGFDKPELEKAVSWVSGKA